MKNSIHALHEKAVSLSKAYHQVERDLIEVIQSIDQMRGYYDLGFKSMHEYCVQALKLSSDVAYILITLARKSREVPALKEGLRSQTLTVSNARMIAPILTKENQSQWLPKAETLSKRELEREIAREFPKQAVKESARFVNAERLELRLGISEELHEKLKRSQDLLSQKLGRAATLEETLQALSECYLEKHDPVEKARRAENRAERREQKEQRIREKENTEGQPDQESGRESGVKESKRAYTDDTHPNASGALVPDRVPQGVVPKTRTRGLLGSGNKARTRDSLVATLKHAVTRRDQGQCTHRDEQGRRCAERRWIDIHHLTPVSRGGQDTLENLVTLCRGHHRMEHHPAGANVRCPKVRQ